MHPHIKLLKIIEAKSAKKRKTLMSSFKEDTLLGELIELMASPEFKHNRNFTIGTVKPEPTVPTKKTFVVFRSMLHRKDKRLESFIERQDSATQFVYKHVANQTDLEISFGWIATTFGLLNRFNYNEYCMEYGFPKLPCYVQVVPSDRLMINVKVGDIATPTYIDGRHYKQMPETVLTGLLSLHLNGDLTGLLVNGNYYITNYYPKTPHTFSKRMQAVESALLRVSDAKVLSYVHVVTAFKVTNAEDLYSFLGADCDIICKQDALPKIGTSKNMIKLNCNQLLKLKTLKEMK